MLPHATADPSGAASHHPFRRPHFLRETGWSAAVLVATVAAMIGLTAISWFTISATSHASRDVRTATDAAYAYNRTRDAIERLGLAEFTYVESPDQATGAALVHAMGSVDIALARLSDSVATRNVPAGSAERRTVRRLDTDSLALTIVVDRATAMAANYNTHVADIDTKVLRPLVGRMLRIANREVAVHQQAADASLTRSQTTDRRASLVVVITGILCLAISWTVVRMLRLRRRLADVHRREIGRLRDAALRDSLTGLRNHRCFQEDIRRSLAADSGLHALLIDMDGLKAINDGLGHQAGDERICQLAAALTTACTGIEAVAYRIGGDEFAIIAAGHNERPERIADAVHAALRTCPGAQLTATIGIASASPGMTADELLRRADMALIVGKPTRSGTRSYSRALENAPGHAEAERAELLAIIDDPAAIMPVYQPIVDLQTGEVLGHEALSRFPAADWRNPQEWFELAHAHDLAVELEAAAVRAALASPVPPARTGREPEHQPEGAPERPRPHRPARRPIGDHDRGDRGRARHRGPRPRARTARAARPRRPDRRRRRRHGIRRLRPARARAPGRDQAPPLAHRRRGHRPAQGGGRDRVRRLCRQRPRGGVRRGHRDAGRAADDHEPRRRTPDRATCSGRPAPAGAVGPAPLVALSWPEPGAPAGNVVPLRRAASA